MTDIFLSYAHENHEQARMLAELLASFGWSVFWDREILAGTVFDDAIQENLDQAKCVVVLWSVHSVASQWVRAEAEEGANRNMLVSVLLDDVRLPIAFRRIQAAKLFNWSGSKDDEQLRDLLKAVRFVVEKPPKENAAAGPPVSVSPGSGYAAATAPARSVSPVAQPKPRSPMVVPLIAAGVLVAAGGGWMMTRSSTPPSPSPSPAPITNPNPNTPVEKPTPGPAAVVKPVATPQERPAIPAPTTVKAALSDQQLLTNAKKFADLLGAGDGRAVRDHFTADYLKATANLTQWDSRKNVNARGALMEVGEPTLLKVTDSQRKQVRVPIKFTNENLACIFTFMPDGQIADLQFRPIRGRAAE